MSDISALDKLFFDAGDLSLDKAKSIASESLHGMDDGELFLEYCQSESVVFDDGKVKSASFDTSKGFGLRSVLGETTAYAHSSIISEESLKRASSTVKSIKGGASGTTGVDETPFGTNKHLYSDLNPLSEIPLDAKIKAVTEIDKYIRDKDPRVRQVTASLLGSWQGVQIIRADGRRTSDIRPLVRLNIAVVVEENGRMEKGSTGAGGRTSYSLYLDPAKWHDMADEALRQALVNLESVPAPAGEMQVVLGPGWPGVLLHEAVGHGLEGDFNRKETSAFSGLVGERVAAKGVTVVDDGTFEDRRGSLSIDDEGTPTSRTVLIEDGILKGYMQDRMNARLMGVRPTGNGRRESYAHQPLPRMTNTFMLEGAQSPEEIIKTVKNGIYAVNFGGGQVDITSGKFVFSASEAYLIEDGKPTRPVKGATLIGNGPDVMKKISMIGNDLALDTGIGTCGKAGQGVPVGVGQPTLLIDGITVGGTEV